MLMVKDEIMSCEMGVGVSINVLILENEKDKKELSQVFQGLELLKVIFRASLPLPYLGLTTSCTPAPPRRFLGRGSNTPPSIAIEVMIS